MSEAGLLFKITKYNSLFVFWSFFLLFSDIDSWVTHVCIYIYICHNNHLSCVIAHPVLSCIKVLRLCSAYSSEESVVIMISSAWAVSIGLLCVIVSCFQRWQYTSVTADLLKAYQPIPNCKRVGEGLLHGPEDLVSRNILCFPYCLIIGVTSCCV